MSIFSRLGRTVGFIYALQMGAAAVFVPMQTEVSAEVQQLRSSVQRLTLMVSLPLV